MKTRILSFFFFLLLPGVIFAEEAKILSMAGQVEARQTREGKWAPASDGMEIAEGGAVRTGDSGAAVLLLPNKSKIWMKGASSLEVEQRQTLASRLALLFGRIKVRVPHLMRKERFEVRTPAAVCAVRGTEFTMAAAEDGKTDLQVLFGEVKLKFSVPPAKGPSEFNIPQGQSLSSPEEGKAAKPALLTASAERAALENWNPGLTPEQRVAGLKQKENDRAQVKEFARVANNTQNELKSFLNVVKESDMEAGRTLNDVHGNLVRVDQRMMRPYANEIQFFNLVKRPVYSNNGASVADGGFAYNGAQGVVNRLDYMQMTMAFNKDLPQRIEDWPGFFDANSVKPDWASFVMANYTKANDSVLPEIFFIAENYLYDPVKDDLRNNTSVVGITSGGLYLDKNVVITGHLQSGGGISAVTGLNKISSKAGVVYDGTDSGQLKYSDGTAVNANGSDVVWAVQTGASYERKGSDIASGDAAALWQFQADKYLIGNKASPLQNDYIWFAKENYGIGNDGSIKTVGDFTNSSKDPFSILKDSALESVMYIKNANSTVASGNPGRTDILDTDRFGYDGGAGTNIDVVFIPDLMVAAVQRMLPAISNLKD